MKITLGKYSESMFLISPPQKESWKALAQPKVNSSEKREGNTLFSVENYDTADISCRNHFSNDMERFSGGAQQGWYPAQIHVCPCIPELDREKDNCRADNRQNPNPPGLSTASTTFGGGDGAGFMVVLVWRH